MKLREIQASKSYKVLLNYTYYYMGIGVILLLFLGVSFSVKEIVLVAIIIVVMIVLGILMWTQVKEIFFIKKNASSFQSCEARVVNVEGGKLRGYLKLVVSFKDQMNEEHRLTTHGIFLNDQVKYYLEKTLTVYYSPKYPIVLVKETHEELQNSNKEDEDPYRL